MPFSAGGVAAIHRESMADDETGARAAKPKNRRGDFFGAAQPADRLVLYQRGDGFWLCFKHRSEHRRLDDAGAYRVYPDSLVGVFEPGAFRQAEHAVLGGAIDASPGDSDETADRRAVHDGAASLLAHLEPLVLHAAPDAAQIDAHHTIEVL